MNLIGQGMNGMLVLAQEAGKEPGFLEVFGFPLMMMMTLYIVFIMLPQSRERRSRAEFMKNLKKNDSVVTYGGIFGTVVGFSADGEQVTLRVDDNTRIRVRRSSIEAVLKSEADEKKPEEKK